MNALPDLTQVAWVRSTYSDGNGGQCIEWAPAEAAATGIVPVRDSKNPSGPTLAFPTDAFAAFINAVKAGELGTI